MTNTIVVTQAISMYEGIEGPLAEDPSEMINESVETPYISMNQSIESLALIHQLEDPVEIV